MPETRHTPRCTGQHVATGVDSTDDHAGDVPDAFHRVIEPVRAIPKAASTDLVDHGPGFADLSRLLHAAATAPATVDLVCRAAVGVLPGAQYASVTVTADNRFASASSDPAAAAFDAAQCEVAQGPGRDAILGQDAVVCDDLRTDDRWPGLQARIDDTVPVRSVMALRLFVEQHTVGSLNVYSCEPAAFSADTVAVAAVFAVHAALAMRAAADRAQVEHLMAALDSNRRIGAAVGILMAHDVITEEAAFAQLRRASQEKHRKLRDIAEEVVRTGELPEQTPRRGAVAGDQAGDRADSAPVS